jgi:CheY-like chemotaxis protein
MLIDDDTITNFLNEMLINELAITKQLIVTTDGNKALEEIKTHQREGVLPDLILLDVNMPVLNGFEFLKKYNELDFSNHESPLIVMLTTSLNEGDKEKAKKLKVNDYMSKPLTKENMLDLLLKYFN